MKTLENLRPNKGANTREKRLGRGAGSGLGKTAGKGNKGMRARKSGGTAPGFEGGQTPLYRRTPKRGFTNKFATEYDVVSLRDLNRLDAGTVVTPKLLRETRLVRGAVEKPIKLLATGALEKKLEVHLHAASSKAKEAVAKAGGKFALIEVAASKKSVKGPNNKYQKRK